MSSKKVIKAEVLFDGKNKQEEMYIIIEDDKIVDVTSKEMDADFEGWVTPAFIDAHSHIGMDRDGEPAQESETNDLLNQMLPLNDPVDSIYFDDRAFKDTVDFGVLYSCVVPGSGNLIGGKAMIIKNFANNRDEAVIQQYGYKMALGYNPRSTTDWKGKRPNTRMGVYALLEEKLDDLLIKKEKAEIQKEKSLNELEKKSEKEDSNLTKEDIKREKELIEKEYKVKFNSEERALLDILSGNKTAKIHVHKEDDVLYLIKLVKKYNLNVTADHTGDVFHKEIFDKLGENNIPVVYGPLGTVGYKTELKHAYYQNAKLLMNSKANFGLMTDHPVIHSYTLRDSLKFFLIQGMSEEDAISLITYKNARILGIDDRLGTVEPEKLASIVVWDKNPLTLGAYPKAVFAEGKLIREN
ncbi:MAG: amidohydrolase family protein [Candidatus Mcinerneyibacterium aminivorans]|uniref:Amidohydrolase family protein n=1 Tax=Candidatus Mcinerneyibacterium aminivorans TaxID=2703815 RepID=A0A5D0MAJ4_9BACT|nr:MAG: amidohydrolase family protein [Candidatus Mcinerneyibacterium aminivorans]